MANRADFFVRNYLEDNITLTRQLPNNTDEMALKVLPKDQEQIHLPDPEVSLVISAPKGVDTKDCPLLIKSDVDLSVTHSRTTSNWIIRIIPNELPPTVPTTVNVDVGENKPG